MQLVEERAVAAAERAGAEVGETVAVSLLGDVVELAPVAAAAVGGVVVGSAEGLEGERVAFSVNVCHVSAACLVACRFEGEASDEGVGVCAREEVLVVFADRVHQRSDALHVLDDDVVDGIAADESAGGDAEDRLVWHVTVVFDELAVCRGAQADSLAVELREI